MYGVGFDIAENMIVQAQETAQKAGYSCDFVACNILEIASDYDDKFDFIFLTIGAITWFKDLDELFGVVSRCLKPGGVLLLHDFHAFMNMLPLPGEEGFDENALDRVTVSYFRQEPWIENNSAGYMSQCSQSRTFTSFSHTISSIINSVIGSGLELRKFNEYDYDVGLSDLYDNKGYPLSFLLMAKKPVE